MAAPDWRIEQLDRTHDRDRFDCGQPSLDRFIKELVSQYEKRNLGRTYVATQGEDRRVLGYHTLSSGALAFQSLPAAAAKKLPKHPVPIVLLARLAVDRSVQGKRLGERLLIDALSRTVELSRSVGVHAVVVDAIDEGARAFYEKYGFLPLLDGELRLFLPVTTIAQAFPK
jgi:GNAT superfamily N-acetyltransferase